MSNYVPWEERLLVVFCPSINMHIATTHIPPGVSNGWLKIDFFEGLFNMLSKHKVILAGDFNSPRKENQNGTLITWGQKISKHGKPYIPKLILGQPGHRWHEAEYNLLKGITQIGYSDFYRSKNGYIDSAYSWKTPSNKEIRYRFDHIIGPSETKICNASYLMEFIENKLSDHTALLVDLQLGVN